MLIIHAKLYRIFVFLKSQFRYKYGEISLEMYLLLLVVPSSGQKVSSCPRIWNTRRLASDHNFPRMGTPFILFTALVLIAGPSDQLELKGIVNLPVNAGPYNFATIAQKILDPNDEGPTPHKHAGHTIGVVLEGEYLLQVQFEKQDFPYSYYMNSSLLDQNY